MKEAPQERAGDGVRRVRDDVKGPQGEPETGCVGAHHHDATVIACAQVRGSSRMGFHGDHPGSHSQQRISYGTQPGPDVEDQIARADARLVNETLGPVGMELVPAPCLPRPAHGGGPP